METSNMTPLHYWKEMVNGKVPSKVLEQIPEEFREESDMIATSLAFTYFAVRGAIEQDFHYVIKCIGGLGDLEKVRKELGLFLKRYGKELDHSGAMFSRLLNDEEALDRYIIKSIKPSGNVYAQIS